MKFCLLLCFLPSLVFGLDYNAKTLKTKDYEEMRAIVNQVIVKARSKVSKEEILRGHEEALEELKKGLKIVFMRPDTDNVVEPLLVSLQSEIMNYRSFLPVFSEFIDQSLKEFNKGSLSKQASHLYLVENSLAYLQNVDDPISLKIIQNIQSSNLKISKKLANYLMLEMGRGKTASPSYLAKRILKTKLKAKKQKQLAEVKRQKALKQKATQDREPSFDEEAVEKRRFKIIPIDLTDFFKDGVFSGYKKEIKENHLFDEKKLSFRPLRFELYQSLGAVGGHSTERSMHR